MTTECVKSEPKLKTHRVRSRRDRWSPEQKAAAVLRLLSGEPVNQLSEELDVSVQRLERWHSDFVAAGAAAMVKKNRAGQAWFAANSDSILQWLGLLFALIVTIAVFAYFLHSGPQE